MNTVCNLGAGQTRQLGKYQEVVGVGSTGSGISGVLAQLQGAPCEKNMHCPRKKQWS